MMDYMEQYRDEMHDVMDYAAAHAAETDPEARRGLKMIAREEYTHARFLRKIMIRMGIYNPDAEPDLETMWHETESRVEEL